MISQTVREALQRFVPAEDLHMEEPMKNHTTFKVGGNAACFIEISPGVQTEKLLLYLKRVEIPYFIMGNGSNLLVSDKGYNGVILHFGRKMDEIRISGDHIYAAAGASLARVAAAAADQGLTGLEFAAGIPGTVGGAVMMNAGAYDGEMKQVVETVTVWNDEGDKLELDNETMEFGYRTSALKTIPLSWPPVLFAVNPAIKRKSVRKWQISSSAEGKSSLWNFLPQAAHSKDRKDILPAS